MQLSTQFRACGTINISKYFNKFLSTNPTTLILSSLISNFTKDPNLIFFGGGGGGGGGADEGVNSVGK